MSPGQKRAWTCLGIIVVLFSTCLAIVLSKGIGFLPGIGISMAVVFLLTRAITMIVLCGRKVNHD